MLPVLLRSSGIMATPLGVRSLLNLIIVSSDICYLCVCMCADVMCAAHRWGGDFAVVYVGCAGIVFAFHVRDGGDTGWLTLKQGIANQ